MEYNEEQEKEYISRESLNRLCKEAQELRWYKRYRSGASSVRRYDSAMTNSSL